MGEVVDICIIGNPVLRQKAAEVVAPDALELAVLVDNMLTSMLTCNGVGIAAPQIGQSQRVIIVASHPNPRYPDAPKMEPVVMINPVILARSPECEYDWEGCLSVPGIRLQVLRHHAVEVSWHDIDGNQNLQNFTGFVARIVQHELDHLDGILFPDTTTKTVKD